MEGWKMNEEWLEGRKVMNEEKNTAKWLRGSVEKWYDYGQKCFWGRSVMH